jgi:shikimate dehydrogenase
MTGLTNALTGKAKLAGVMGWPVGHSRSPTLHGHWLATYGIDGAYVPLPVRPEDFAGAVRALASLGFRGVNVTVPHKEAAFRIADVRDAAAERMGAVNTLVFRDGKIYGSNTDGAGFLAHLKATAPEWRPESAPVVLLGAGGAARAIAAALADAGVPDIRVVNRTFERALALAQTMDGPLTALPWVEREEALEDAGLLINATRLGMTGEEPLDIDVAGLPDGAVVYDIVYAPLETPLLADARALGLTAVDGLGMLLHQAAPGFAAWFGVTPEVTPELRAAVLAGG